MRWLAHAGNRRAVRKGCVIGLTLTCGRALQIVGCGARAATPAHTLSAPHTLPLSATQRVRAAQDLKRAQLHAVRVFFGAAFRVSGLCDSESCNLEGGSEQNRTPSAAHNHTFLSEIEFPLTRAATQKCARNKRKRLTADVQWPVFFLEHRFRSLCFLLQNNYV